MTSGQDMPQDAFDKVLDHNRLQLSAMLDGALAPDQARFLLRRLQHDEELAGCWSRWQLAGDILRGQGGATVSAGFSQRVAVAVAAESPAAARGPARWTKWGPGAALAAASVAAIALFVTRQLPEGAPAAQTAPTEIASAAVAPRPMPARPAAPGPAPAPQAPDGAARVAAVAAVAEVPRRAAVRRSRAQSQRAAIRTPVRRSVEPQLAVAVAAAAPVIATDPANPFAPRASTITTRPWPRALLPGAPGAGAFNVDYGSAPAPATTFYPFQPRAVAVPVTPQQAPAAGGDDGHTPR
ncbi:sigma-E factor negative regulatory protein [Luteimonas sp. 50]|uniref:Sigma-E factor negative regulatory protein n=1 Tax=Cognatiluteimonas sedimenti TaxID=2927791 RepID=A0ABT0A099_9GAMM|nr:sigma-E factor negative regulatory protein [Lysobacter sedimenti]MCJ0824378.1 sigma-E factor negative regulatory protein [Lysobacter sedimenti]